MEISVVIPAYNSEAFIRSALESIDRQTVPVREILVVDDGSTDSTRQRVAEWQGRFPVRLLEQPNRGPSAARNRGVEAARGTWIAFLDADDRWTPEHLEEQQAVIERHPELRLVAADMAEVSPGGEILVPSVLEAHGLKERFETLDGAPLPHALARLVEKNFIPTGTVLARRDVLLEAGLFDPRIRFGEDLDLWARVAARHPITCLARVHMLRTRHDSNASAMELPMLLDLIEVNRKLREQAAETLRRQGKDPDLLVAEALWTAGYWHFARGDHRSARGFFLRSLREKPGLRPLRHLLLSLAPPGLLRRLRAARG